MNNKRTKAIVVLSGGQDSTTCLFLAKSKFDEVYTITFDYGQKHRREIGSAELISNMANICGHETIRIPGILNSVSPLVDFSKPLEQYENAEQMETVIGNRIETTFVPMRNMLFLTIAMNRAVELGCDAIVMGICQEDNANYPDCTEYFREAFEIAANRALGNYTKESKEILVFAPLMYLSKAESVKLAATIPGCMKALAYSHTSYDGKYPPTDMNHANILRAKGFEEAGYPDPLVVRAVCEGLMVLPPTKNYDIVLEEISKDPTFYNTLD